MPFAVIENPSTFTRHASLGQSCTFIDAERGYRSHKARLEMVMSGRSPQQGKTNAAHRALFK
eukprot:4909-Eustigmatos_ZCMA.PRE.1